MSNRSCAAGEHVNPFLLSMRMLGCSHAEFIGKTLGELGALVDIFESKRLFTQIQSKGYVRYENLPLRTAGGQDIILVKPGKLLAVEFELIKHHTQAGFEVLKDVEFPWPVELVALRHHERLDGSGYPQGLKGEQILLEARNWP